MNVSSFPDLLGFTQRNRTTVQLREQLNIASQESVTGLNADMTKATSGDVGRAHLLQKTQNDIIQAKQINNLSTTRLSMMTDAISAAREAADNIGTRSQIALLGENPVEIGVLIDEADTTLRSVMSALSTRQGTRNLFSGNMTDQLPFADPDVLLDDVRNILTAAVDGDDAKAQLEAYFYDPAGGFQTNIYQGGDASPPDLPIGNGATIPLDVKGDSGAIVDMLFGLSVTALADEISTDFKSNDFTTVFEFGAIKASAGSEGFISLEGQLGIYSESLSKAEDRLTAQTLTAAEAYTDLFGRDQFEAAAELQSLQVQLEASYTITSRLSSLNLTNFI